ncbi:MAG: VOC family protein [Opitutaceae bacterium]
MKIEHFALNVADPTAMAAWYTKHLGLKVVRAVKASHDMHFLADDSGTVMLEIYNNPPDQVPPYAKMDPLLLHLAFVSKDPEAEKTALLAAGATLASDQHLADGSHLVMLRDPWGLAIQLCKRAKPMLTAG